MDPLTGLGALSGAAQLLDASIKFSHSAYRFLDSLKHATEDIRLLRKGMSRYRPPMHM